MDQYIIKETWLSKKPAPLSAFISALFTFLLALISLIYWRDLLHAQRWMTASNQAVFEHHEVWRAWTCLFIHADEKHLFSNSFLFFILGTFLGGHFGILIFPVLALFMGGLVNLIVLAQMPLEVQLLGASGIVYWMGGAWLILYFLLERKRTLFQRALRAIGVGLLLFIPAEAFDPSISYLSHSLGFFTGVFSGLIFYLTQRKMFLAAEVKEVFIDEPEEPLPDLP